MSKYITKDLHKKFVKFIPDLEKKTTLSDLWNKICEKFEIDGEIIVDLVRTKKACIKFVLKGKEYTIERKASDIVVVGDNGNVKSENYEILILDALKTMLEQKLLRKSKKNKKEKD